MKTSHVFAVLGALTLGIFAGCGGGESTETTKTTSAGASAAAPKTSASTAAKPAASASTEKKDAKPEGSGHPDGRGDKHGHHAKGGGPGMLIHAALKELQLTDAQKTTLEAELASLKDSKPEHAGPQAMHAALSEAIRSGKIDEAALTAKLTSAAPTNEEMRTKFTKTVAKLHETLTPEQRKSLVEKMKSHMENGPGKEHGKDHPKDGKGPEGKGPGKPGHGAGGPFEYLLHGLDLTDDQKKKVEEALAGLKPTDADKDGMKQHFELMKKEREACLDAFATDKFDAGKCAPPAKGPDAKHLTMMVKALAAIVPILEPAQREKLADHLEEGPWHRGGHGPKGDPKH